jgi:hypothetical protein
MVWITLDDNREIMRLIDQVISERIEIRIRVEGEKTPFTSQIIKMDRGGISSEIKQRPELIIERLLPEKGDFLIQSLPEVGVEFSLNQSLCRCAVACIGPGSTPPQFSFILSLPESLEIEERRREERVTHETPEFFSATFGLGKNPKSDKLYELNILNRSNCGLGLIVSHKDLDLLRILKKGDRLNNITLLASWAMTVVNSTVSHITEIEQGKHKGCYVLGIDSGDMIESSRPNSD